MHMRQALVIAGFFTLAGLAFTGIVSAKAISINARSAMLVDMKTSQVLYEQNPDLPIAPASITKVLTLYMVFEAIRGGRLHLWDNVKVSGRAAKTGGSRMGLRTGDVVSVGELIKGMAVVSGNDACVAIAEHMSGSVESFVRQMNAKARQLGMNDSHFLTPNGLPAKGQITTARDIATLSVAYIRRYPEALNIHSMQSYTYRTTTHRNANRLLGTCQGVDGLKTGFVCAAGYNLTATAVRGDSRLVAVVLGASSPGVRAAETARLLELGYESLGTGTVLTCAVDSPAGRKSAAIGSSGAVARTRGKGRTSDRTVVAETPAAAPAKGKAARSSASKSASATVGSDSGGSTRSDSRTRAAVAAQKGNSLKTIQAKGTPAVKTQGSAQASNSGKVTGRLNAPKATASKAGGSAAATELKKSSSSGTEKSASTRNPKSSSPAPPTGKNSSPRKPSTQTVELAKPKS